MNAPFMTHAMTQRTVRVGARTISFTEAGEPVVLMLHGGGPGASGMSNYARNVGALACVHRVVVPDMPGYGKSTKGLDRGDPFGDLAASMLGMLDALRIERAHILGNSLGGACALRMAIERPAAVGRLVLMARRRGYDAWVADARPQASAELLQGRRPDIAKLATFIRGDLVYDGSLVSDATLQERFQSSIDPEVVASPPLLGPKGIPQFRKLDFTRDPRLAGVQNPTLVLWGTEDKVNRPSGARSLQRRMPNCDVHLFSKTGHWVQWSALTNSTRW